LPAFGLALLLPISHSVEAMLNAGKQEPPSLLGQT